jgi:2-polyprenyl-3-methyl-5-hydroxy-6-metoxy-1,4-benzoquinol methylase
MDDPAQAAAYARADFAEENDFFVRMFCQSFPDLAEAHIVDLGCGPADIPIRLARAWPGCRVTAVDASPAMIALAHEAVRQAGLADRIAIRQARVQDVVIDDRADAVISNSLVHHIPNPLQFWYALPRLAKPGAPVLVMDLLRAESPEAAQEIVDRYAAGEAEILRRDFYNSLLAAFTEDEIASQLAEMNLSRLLIDVPDDRHWIVTGTLPGTRAA